eukprot:365303-Chlamydomonas_euryale.AAC.16
MLEAAASHVTHPFNTSVSGPYAQTLPRRLARLQMFDTRRLVTTSRRSPPAMSCAGYALTATLVRTRCRGPANAHASPMRLAWRAGNYRARVPGRH